MILLVGLRRALGRSTAVALHGGAILLAGLATGVALGVAIFAGFRRLLATGFALLLGHSGYGVVRLLGLRWCGLGGLACLLGLCGLVFLLVPCGYGLGGLVLLLVPCGYGLGRLVL